MYLEFGSSKLSTPWGYFSAVVLCVATFGTIDVMSGLFLKPDVTFDSHLIDVVPLFGGFISILGASEEAPVVEKIEVAMETKKVKKGDSREEDVDIGDEMPMSSFPPVEIEKTLAITITMPVVVLAAPVVQTAPVICALKIFSP
ncbi:hypothetical protein LWI28_018839 [Acer negundo]|uniref:Uncharacterized protein n=1 Tax=Acer negundo TaxID=4023 RepID=A0AAD5NK16_ACENE|nr:hypothetical protein LWI28_018839 [Acer negundo]KAK4838575.1 hypothetical protein QYF36_014836 [Acer negundo]